MGKVSIDRDDKNRILLTELLPFEVPMLFSNEGFYSIVSKGNYNRFFNRVYDLSQAKPDRKGHKYGIPFNYEVKKSIEGESRTLSVMHPMNQVLFIDLYSKYNTLMIHLCSKSSISLRKISKIANYFYSPDFVFEEDSHKSPELEVEPDVLDEETRYLKSYFIYKPIDLIYKFYEKYDYQRLEQRFNYLMEFDITKCFYHIYTHSITWAIKDKESAKRNAGQSSFENLIDKIMQLSNYNETNGIIVGPEISRIFAEIILQQIDVNVLGILENTEGLKVGIDFEIRRYVDDYFVFSNEEKILKTIKSIFQKELGNYKLYLNPLKGETKSTPFITNIAVGKRELNQLLISFYKENIVQTKIQNADGKIENSITIKKNINPYKDSQYFIKDFQCIVKRNGLTYDILSKEIIRYSKSSLVKVLKNDKIEKNDEIIERFFLMVLDILFYAYSLNINANTTFKLSQIIVLICKFLQNKEGEIKHTIFSKIFKDSDFILTNFKRKSKKNETNIETLNLLIALKKLGYNYRFSEKSIKELFSLDKTEGFQNLNYFQIVSILYYIDDNSDYEDLRNNLELTVIQRFDADKDPFTKAELTLLFFDFISCPFVDIEAKRKVMKATKYSIKNSSNQTIDIIISDICEQKKWFMDWDIEIDLERVLKKKEWGNSY